VNGICPLDGFVPCPRDVSIRCRSLSNVTPGWRWLRMANNEIEPRTGSGLVAVDDPGMVALGEGLVAAGRAQACAVAGRGGLLSGLTKQVLETALQVEMGATSLPALTQQLDDWMDDQSLESTDEAHTAEMSGGTRGEQRSKDVAGECAGDVSSAVVGAGLYHG
jgi:hypothetical protein